MQWSPPIGAPGPGQTRPQIVVRIDPDSRAEAVAATLPAVPVPISQGGLGLAPDQAVALDGSLYLLEPPLQEDGYLGYSRLVRITPS